MPTTTRSGYYGLSPFLFFSNIVVWVSAVIVMGILSYFISQNNNQGNHVIYEEVIAVLTVAFFLISFFLGTYAGYLLMFNIIFSYLWLVSVVFTAEDWTYADSALAHTVEAFSFIAFFFLFFNVVHDWHLAYLGGTRSTSRV